VSRILAKSHDHFWKNIHIGYVGPVPKRKFSNLVQN
jgi:hypothetical protein